MYLFEAASATENPGMARYRAVLDIQESPWTSATATQLQLLTNAKSSTVVLELLNDSSGVFGGIVEPVDSQITSA